MIFDNTNNRSNALYREKLTFYLLTALFFFLVYPASSGENAVKARLKADVEYLCSPVLAGRNVPGETGDETALWVAERMFNRFLMPAVGDTSFLQKVPLVSANVDTINTTLTLNGVNDKRYQLQWGDFYTFPKQIALLDTSFDIETCGYGIVSDELNMNDFKKVDGKCAVVLDGIGDLSAGKIGRYAMAPFKAAAAERAGAAMMMVVYENPSMKLWFPDDLKRKINAVNQPLIDLPSSEAGFPVIYTHKSLLPQDMQSIQFEMAFDNIDTVHGYNVVGRLEGNIREYVVIGAHYDHLGVVKNSGNGDYYAGADDNASGVAGLLEICRRWAGRDRNGRGLIAVSFTAEEDGMLGSRWFVDHLPVPRESIVAMINMDEIGRRGFASMRDVHRQDAPADAKYTVAYYSGASLQLEELIESAARGIDLNVSANPVNSFSHFGDAGAFHEAQIPTVNIFSGFHSDYHKPSDTPDKLDYVKMAEIIKFVDALLIELSMSHERIRFDPRIKVEKPVIPH